MRIKPVATTDPVDLKNQVEEADERYVDARMANIRLRQERDEWKRIAQEYKVLLDRASGSLCDASTVPTGTPEDGIKALTGERDAALAKLAEVERDRADAVKYAEGQRDLTDYERSETNAAQAKRATAEAGVVVLRTALQDAIEGLTEILPYVDDYYREKWNHDGYLKRAQTALSSTDGIGTLLLDQIRMDGHVEGLKEAAKIVEEPTEKRTPMDVRQVVKERILARVNEIPLDWRIKGQP